MTPPGERETCDDRRPPPHAWLAYVLPLAVFLVVGSFEPTREQPGGAALGLAIPYTAYPVVYGLKILATVTALAWAWPTYRQFPRRVGPLAIGVGLVGAVMWIGLARLRLEAGLLDWLGLQGWANLGVRSGFNPLAELAGRPLVAWAVLGLRLFGLVAVVAVAEEVFLRGFVMRVVVAEDWQRVRFGQASTASLVVGTLVPMLLHPGELLAAAVWFTLVTWLMVRTRSLWDCITAHAVTNLGLAVYVLASGHWELL